MVFWKKVSAKLGVQFYSQQSKKKQVQIWFNRATVTSGSSNGFDSMYCGVVTLV